MSAYHTHRKQFEHLRSLIVFTMLGTLMFVSDLAMEALPNVHILGMLTMVYTVVYRVKGLIPIYIYVFLTALMSFFSSGYFLWWWVPYLYIWPLLWGATMLLPRKMPPRVAGVIYPILCGLHGFLFGILYAPVQALMLGFDLPMTMAWIASGVYFDLIHGIANIFIGTLVLPLSAFLKKLEAKRNRGVASDQKKFFI